MTPKELAGLIRRAGFAGVTVACRTHPDRPARFFCPACRRACCLSCTVLSRRRLRCEECSRAPEPGRSVFRILLTPMGASAAAILTLTIFALIFHNAFEVEPRIVSYSPVGEPPAVARAMLTLEQAFRLRSTAEAFAKHGDAARGARWTAGADRTYQRFESLYPADDMELPKSFAVAAARYARATMSGSAAELQAVARDFWSEPAGVLAAVETMRARIESGDTNVADEDLRLLQQALTRVGDFGDQLAKAFASQKASLRRMAIEAATGMRFSKAEADLEVSYLLGRVHEASGRKGDAIADYEKIAAAAWAIAPWAAEARARLGRLRAAPETIKVERFKD